MCLGIAPHRADDPQRGRGRRQPRRAVRRADRARRDRRRVGARVGRARRRDRQAPERADRRPVRGEEAARVLARAARPRAARVAAGPGRRGADVERVGDGVEGRGRHRHRRRPRAAARAGHGAVRDHDLRVAGADAVRRRARAARRGAWPSARSGRSARRRSASSPTRAACACSRTARSSATCRSRRSSTTARSTTSSRPSRREPVYARAARAARPADADAGRDAARADGRAQHRLQALGLRAVRHARRLAHDARARARATARCCRSSPTAATARSPCRSTATAAASPATRSPAPSSAVLECAQNLACAGAEPLGLTNCLNFGNPEKPHIAWQLSRAIDGIAAACRALERAGHRRQRVALQRGRRGPDLPVADRRHGRQARRPGERAADGLARRGRRRSCWSARSRRRSTGSELEKQRGGLSRGAAASSTWARRRARCRWCAALVASGLVASIHDVSDGGLACALAESCIATRGQLGARVDADRRAGPHRTTPRCSARGPAAGSSPCPPDAVGRGRGNRADLQGLCGSARLAGTGWLSPQPLLALTLPVSDLRDAYESGVADRLR